MIVQIHGTSGAGKSTLARALMNWFTEQGGKCEPVVDKAARILGYKCTAARRTPVYLVGKYTTPCGGCDQVGSSVEVLRRVRLWARGGHVVFEGLLLSGGQGSLGRAMLKYGRGFAYAFLDTPLEKCLKRVQGRRDKRAKANGRKAKPLNPKNTTSKWHACQRYAERARELGYHVHVLPHREPLPVLLEMLGLV